MIISTSSSAHMCVTELTDVTHWCSAVQLQSTIYHFIHTVCKIIKAMYGVFFCTHPYLHMYNHLHVLVYKSEIYLRIYYFTLGPK